MRANDTLWIHGRADSQTNLNGNRLNLMEIEGQLRLAAAVRNAVVVVAAVSRLGSGTAGQPQLMALVEPETVDAAAAKEYVADNLPRHMVPAVVLAVPELPRYVMLTSCLSRRCSAVRCPSLAPLTQGKDTVRSHHLGRSPYGVRLAVTLYT